MVVAAGGSTRLGQPKQLLLFGGKPLVARAAEAAIGAGASPVVVVLGAYEDGIRETLAGLPLVMVPNPSWEEGMGSSICVGVAHGSAQAPQLDALLVAVCDQPHFHADAIGALCAAFCGHDSIVAACYAGRLGVPVLFGRDYFGPLGELRGDKGAQRILRDHASQVVGVDLPELATDVDTLEDYRKLMNVGVSQ